MTQTAAIDLSSYSVPDILEPLEPEAYIARDKADLLARWSIRRAADPTLPPLDTLEIETDPIPLQLESAAYRETLLVARMNDRVRALTLAGAKGAALDHIGLTYFRGTARLTLTPANPETGAAAVMEGDDAYRLRLALSPESWSTCGPEGAYIFFAASASGDVLDAAVYSEEDGVGEAPEVTIAVLSRTGDGTAGAPLLALVRAACNPKDRRPIGDLVTVVSAAPETYDIAVTVKVRQGASSELVRAAAEKRIRAYAEGRIRWMGDDVDGPVWLVGRRIRQDTIAASAYVEGVVEVEVTEPSSDVNAPGVGSGHLLVAPRLGTLTVTAEPFEGPDL